MKKTAIIGFANLYSMPYAAKYIDAVENLHMDYDIIYWDRENEDSHEQNHYVFHKAIDSSKNVALKLSSFFQFKKFAMDVLKKNKYDKIIVLYSLPAVLLKGYLKRNYKDNYIFAYTDYTFENNPIYRRWIKTAVENSYLTTITSEGFLRYLPDTENIMVSHNAAGLDEERGEESKKSNDKIAISYIGMLRQYEHIRNFLAKLANDERFVLNYYGNGFCEEQLRGYISDNDIKNVHVHGRYNPEDKSRLIRECDIINNCFENDIFQKYAMTNRFYDAVIHYKPQIVNAGSYSEQVVKDSGLGIAIDPEDKNLGDKIHSWYMSLDKKALLDNCMAYRQSVIEDESRLRQKLMEYLGS